MTQQDEGEGMRMTLEERIEAAAKAVRWAIGSHNDLARAALTAAFPELFSSPPEAWLAPWEATESMLDALADPEAYPGSIEEAWAKARDASLSPKE
jgi:hypothetical protein